ALGVGDQHRRAGVDEGLGVAGLVVAGGAGEGHEHRRDAGGGQFGHRRGPGPADGHGGGGVEGGHDVLVGEQPVVEGVTVAPGGCTAARAPGRTAIRLARPGAAFCSWTTVGIRWRRAATRQGSEAYPPTPTTTAGRERRTIRMARPKAWLVFRTTATFSVVSR